MDSHIVHPHDQEYNRDPQHLGTHQGEDEDHHEKKSVLKKMKEKAKKIKDTLKKPGHGHDHQEGHIPDDHDLDEEEDEEDEDAEKHGATSIKSGVPEQGDILKVPLVKFGDTKAKHDDPVGSNPERTDVKISDPMRDYVQPEPGVMLMHDDVLEPMDYSGSTMGSVLGEHEEISGQPHVNFGRTSEMGGGLHAPQNAPVSSLGEYQSKVTDPSQTSAHGKEGHFGKEGHLGQSRVDTTPVSSLEEYKSKVTDPSQTFAHGKEGHLGQSRVDTTPVSSLEEYKSKVTDPSQTFAHGKEGHLGQSRVDTTPVSSLEEYKSKVTDPSQTFAHGKEGHLGQSRVDTTPVSSLEEYKSKVTDPSQTFAHGKEGHLGQSGVDTAPVSSLETFASGNEGHLGQSRVNLERPRGLEEDPYPQAYTPSNYQNKVTDPTNAGGEEVGITPILHSLDKMNIHDGTEQSSYTDKIPSAPSAIADKAISAKNVVGSKLGYGGNNDQHGDIKPQACTASSNAGGGGDEQKPHQNLSTGSHDQFSAERPSNQSSTYTEKISSATSAIADKAISAKNVVASKLGYGGNNDDDHHQEVTAKPGGSTSPEPHGKGVSQSKAGLDKGVSVKDYFAEKLKPSEEDRALSEVISEALHKPKAEDSARPLGKVTESEEVTRRLGPDCGIERVEQSSYGKIVSDAVKGAVGSLFGKIDENPSSQQSTGSSTGGTDGFSSSGSGTAEHPGLQGSGN
ncbi:low-temperature-induced 65 kDa protein-like isoform X2 [Prunus dulcis]|uniref:low-temperature-induced 65 kDa protein-like isoform X2 n=1 Tax=Prunus dulcis TaxID=3755 RepID=UPI001482D44C|nr:low-temperature-induced 65 kDa protein-like isoform X2 [Prunus dulcis]